MTTVRLNAEIDGAPDAPALLLGGSLGTTVAMWDPQVATLSQDHRLVRFDHRGHGGSPVPPGPYSMDDLGADVLTLMDRLGLERASYCGVSIGGMVGQWLAVNAPERIDRLVLICTSAYLPPAENWHERARAVREAGTPEAVADAVLSRWFTPEFAEREPGVLHRHRTMICSIAAEGYAGCCEAIAGMDLRAGLGRVTAPTLVLAGAQDPAIPPEHGEAIAAAVPGARLEVLDPGAHLLNVERAGEVTELVAEHLGGPA
ncbi:MAG TPA: 3-oxoadipate enol-lactonase [Solirubrobacteraceae bacterium]|nr:3-oxoadipate enol-lactonase [Solirubrobacteraceae bacterium]